MRILKSHPLLNVETWIFIIILTLRAIFTIKYMWDEGSFFESKLFYNDLHVDPDDDVTTCVHVTDPDAPDCHCPHEEAGEDYHINDADDRCHVCSQPGATITCDLCFCLFHAPCLPENCSLHSDWGSLCSEVEQEQQPEQASEQATEQASEQEQEEK